MSRQWKIDHNTMSPHEPLDSEAQKVWLLVEMYNFTGYGVISTSIGTSLS